MSYQNEVYMYRSEQINELLSALVNAKKTIEPPKKIKKAYGYFYAPLDEVLRAVEPSLLANNLFISHDRALETNEIITYIYHVSGQFISTKVKIEYKADNKMNFMQSLGSASTYGMRYNILALLNLCGEDDDDGVSSGDKHTKDIKPIAEVISKDEQKLIVEKINKAGAIEAVKTAIKKLPHEWTQTEVAIIEAIISKKVNHA